MTYSLLSLTLVAIVAGAMFLIPAGDPEELPSAVESYSPRDGDLVANPIKVVIDLQANYRVQFVIDGIPIPQAQMDSIVETGRHQFSPGEGKVIERWSPGDHTVIGSWIGGQGEVDGGTLVWTFTVR